jgi:excalibur calcium-binding domain-containing protein
MKRLLLAAVLLTAMTACGDADTPPDTGVPTTTTTTVEPAPTTTTTTPAPVTSIEAPVEQAPIEQPPVEPPPVQPPPVDPPPVEAPSAYYANCAEARAAGAAPIHRGEPGYRAGLDRDGDGTACDK